MSRPEPGTQVRAKDLTPGLYIDATNLISHCPDGEANPGNPDKLGIVNHVTVTATGRVAVRSSSFTGDVDENTLVLVVG